MNLKQLSETISCNHINFLNKKYDCYNSYIYTNQTRCSQLNGNIHNIIHNDRTLLKSINVTKKSCTYKPPIVINNVDDYTIDYLNTVSSFPVMFNTNTRLKTAL